MSEDDPVAWFRAFTGNEPYPWQSELLVQTAFTSRLIRIPTGFGKTLGVLAAWTWNRVVRKDPSWPRRLVLCLPMRVLVEQTEAVVRETLTRAGLYRTERGEGASVHLLMGGTSSGEWHLDVDGDAVLIGTQDMLLSRALNRGYAASRARWPVEFGLLHQDALWVLDEVQLMDVGLATSAQLEAFVAAGAAKGLRPAGCWWMSATLQRSWLRSVDTAQRLDTLSALTIPKPDRRGHLWDDVRKPVVVKAVERSKKVDLAAAMADSVLEAWRGSPRGLTLVVLNTVDRACDAFTALEKVLSKEAEPPELRLVHSRFRPAERAAWRGAFLRRDASIPPGGRIIVATQVVEAGVDLDADLLVTELAPWPSLVQRFGRAARGGGEASILVLDPRFEEDREAAPYAIEELAGARSALDALDDVSPARLEAFEEETPREQIARLYPYKPSHLLMRREIDELFDTTPDLTGADLDISRFIRSGDERDCTVAWVDVPAAAADPSKDVQPPREALCPVPFLRARAWLCGESDKTQKTREGVRAWVWDWIDGAWKRVTRSAILPGRTVLVASTVGGYDPIRGFDPRATMPVTPIAPKRPLSSEDKADASQDGEPQSEYAYKTIATHGAEVAAEAVRVAEAVGLPKRYRDVLRVAGLWHDLGKAHPAFQGSIRAEGRPGRQDLAKAPDAAWPRQHLYRSAETGERRPGFRHELASALALFAVLEAHRPGHPALLGPWGAIFGPPPTPSAEPPTPVEQEILSLDSWQFDLVAFLVASHHGKVRARLHAAPADQDYRARDERGQPIRGVREGDAIPATRLDAANAELPELRLTLEPAAMGLSSRTGRSWTERVAGLLESEGPFVLAFLEACLRAADVRASRLTTSDPLLSREGGA